MKRTLMLGFALLVGCFTPAQRREEMLTREARMFDDDFRWGRWEHVAPVMSPEEGQLFAKRAEEVRDEFIIADSDFQSLKFGSPSDQATATVKLDWYWKRDMVVHQTVIEQTWEYREGRWLCSKLRRLRGDRFPMVTEPVKPPPGTPAPAPVKPPTP